MLAKFPEKNVISNSNYTQGTFKIANDTSKKKKIFYTHTEIIIPLNLTLLN
jgi:hypothetical protein